ncbi:DNA topoisomerase IV subunit B, partial [Rhizobium sp. KAs_5_22]
ITLTDAQTEKKIEYIFENGLHEFIKDLTEEFTPITDTIKIEGTNSKIEVEIALKYTEDYNETILGFANNVKTSEGGAHITGFKSGLVRP